MCSIEPNFDAEARSAGIEVLVERSFLVFRSPNGPVGGARRSRSCPPPTAGGGVVLGADVEEEAPKMCLKTEEGTELASYSTEDSELLGDVSDSWREFPCPVSPVSPAPGAWWHSQAEAEAFAPDQHVGAGDWPMWPMAAAGWQLLEDGWGPASADALAGLPSVGSAEHGFGMCKPCVFFAHGFCVDGAQCLHCHVPHEGLKWKKSRPPKFIRLALRSRADALAAGRPHAELRRLGRVTAA